MGIGPKDRIDHLLVKKYAKEQVDNHSELTSMIDPEKMMTAMDDYATMYRNMNALSGRLKSICYGVNSMAAKYRKSPSAA